MSRFKTDAGVQVLLLPLKTGNHGMSLAEAQRVFIVEPCLIPAIEAQATARVRRLNQTERTFVHRYAMLGTVEQVISRAMMPRLQQLELKFEAAPSLSAAEWSHPLTRHDLFMMFNEDIAGGSAAEAGGASRPDAAAALTGSVRSASVGQPRCLMMTGNSGWPPATRKPASKRSADSMISASSSMMSGGASSRSSAGPAHDQRSAASSVRAWTLGSIEDGSDSNDSDFAPGASDEEEEEEEAESEASGDDR